jgi:tetratricopeptide (TPR) repeat protein
MNSKHLGLLAAAAEHCEEQRCEDAISSLETVLRDQPANPDLHHQIGFCYSGACRRHSLQSLPLAISYFEHALSLIGSHGPAAVRARYLDSLGNAYLAAHQPTRAVQHLEEAAQIYQHLGLPDDWARQEYNLGNACCDLAETGVPDMWERAAEHYQNALRVRTERYDPLHFAATMQNLGTVYRELSTGNRATNVRKAIGCYCAAFRVYAAAHLGDKCADLHNNIGNAYLNLSASEEPRCRNFRRALRHFAQALRVRNKLDRPRDYAVTQFNRGQAFLLLAGCEESGDVRPAAECFREALDTFLCSKDAPHAEMAKRRLEGLALLPGQESP